MRDVEYHLLERDGRSFYNLKALTERAREFMCTDMVGSVWALAQDVFWMHVDPAKFLCLIARLRAAGLTTEAEDEQPTPDEPVPDELAALTTF